MPTELHDYDKKRQRAVSAKEKGAAGDVVGVTANGNVVIIEKMKISYTKDATVR